jgi:predicted metal-binding membrane protein
LALAAHLDEFSRQPWRSLLLLCCAGVACLLLTERHHQHFAVAWAIMLLAMMPPLLAQPITHIVRSSRTRRRVRALFAFGVGYTFVWMLAGPLLMAMSRLLSMATDDDGAGALVAATLLALVWTATPWHQVALNRGHRIKNLAVFGWRADLDAITYGIVHGAWCVASCWAWMLVPLGAGLHHSAAMIVVTLVMLIERLAAPARPKWRLPRPVRLLVNRFRAGARAFVTS